MAGCGNATVVEQLQMGRRPSLLSNRFTGQVHHPLSGGQCLLKGTALRPAAGLGGITLHPLDLLIRRPAHGGAGTPAHQRQLMACLLKGWNQLPSDQTSAAEQEQTHGKRSRRKGATLGGWGGVEWRIGAGIREGDLEATRQGNQGKPLDQESVEHHGQS